MATPRRAETYLAIEPDDDAWTYANAVTWNEDDDQSEMVDASCVHVHCECAAGDEAAFASACGEERERIRDWRMGICALTCSRASRARESFYWSRCTTARRARRRINRRRITRRGGTAVANIEGQAARGARVRRRVSAHENQLARRRVRRRVRHDVVTTSVNPNPRR